MPPSPAATTSATRVLVATADTLGPRMAGPAIRARALAQVLARAGHPVDLITTQEPCELDDPLVSVRAVPDAAGLRAAVAAADVVILQGWVFSAHPWIWKAPVCRVVDLYDPLYLEALEQNRSDGDEYWWAATRNAREVVADQVRQADFLLCASERQRALWLGHLAAEGRINPKTYDADPTLRNLVDLVPFGIPDEPPQRNGPGVRDLIEGIGADDPIVLWGGGIYEWFDPITLVEAMDGLRRRIPDVRLVFMGARHPSPAVPDMPVVAATRARIAELGLEEHVLLHASWVAYEQRQNLLLDATVAVTTHKDHVETEFSYRTRVLDYLWAARPIVTSDGDVLADLVREEGLGVVVPPGDVDALEEALHRVLTDADFAAGCRERIERIRPRFSWSRTAQPLLRYCADPIPAADLADPLRDWHQTLGDGVRPSGWAGLRFDLHLARHLWAEGGTRHVAQRARQRVRRLRGAT